MNILIASKKNDNIKEKQIKIKAALLDRFLEIIEDELLARLMEDVEKEKNISFSKAKKLMK